MCISSRQNGRSSRVRYDGDHGSFGVQKIREGRPPRARAPPARLVPSARDDRNVTGAVGWMRAPPGTGQPTTARATNPRVAVGCRRARGRFSFRSTASPAHETVGRLADPVPVVAGADTGFPATVPTFIGWAVSDLGVDGARPRPLLRLRKRPPRRRWATVREGMAHDAAPAPQT